jgi:mRNA-degrading endonuclease YafQ of YafQ-DinJ toxin-antitoxin module
MKTIHLLKSDPFYPSLKTHYLHGDLEGLLACSVKYTVRIVFNIMKNPDTEKNEILLIDIGTHEDVY